MRMRKSFSHLKWFALNLDLKQRLGYLGNCLIPRAFLRAVETIAGKLLCYNGGTISCGSFHYHVLRHLVIHHPAANAPSNHSNYL